MTQVPTIGRIVLFHEGEDAPEHPAIVTKVWSSYMVNLMVFVDGGDAQSRTNVRLGEMEYGWRWPPIVPQPAQDPAAQAWAGDDGTEGITLPHEPAQVKDVFGGVDHDAA